METETKDPKQSTNVPPYFAFRTLQNTLEDMKKRGIPARVDRTYLVGMSGAGQTQFLAGLRSLGLIDAAGKVKPRLEALVNASGAERQRLMGDLLRERYPEAVELGKTNATTGQLIEVFRDYGAQGDTARKAIAFYLQAAKFAGDVPVSPMFQTPKVSATASGKRRTTRRTTEPRDQDEGTGNDSSHGAARGPAIPDLHPALAGVLSELPPKGTGWTRERREEFMKTFEAVANFTIPVVEEDGPAGEEFAAEEGGDEE